MRNHDKFIEIPVYEKWILQGKLWHIYSTSPSLYEELNKIIKIAADSGVLDDVRILPPSKPENDLPNDH